MPVIRPGLTWRPNPHFWPGRFGLHPKWIILHGTAGGSDAQNVAGWLERPASESSVHFIIGRDGLILQTVNLADSAWGNGILEGIPGKSGDGVHYDAWWSTKVNPNTLTISIEHVKGTTDNSEALTDVQKLSSFHLIAWLCENMNIPKHYADSSGGITGHYSLEAISRRNCPGNYPWQELFAYLATTVAKPVATTPITKPIAIVESLTINLKMPKVAEAFEETPAGWKSKLTGFFIHGAILAFYCKFGNELLNGLTWLGHPTGDEIQVKEYLVVQRFQNGVVCWNPNRVLAGAPEGVGNVYLLDLSSEYGSDPRIATIQTLLDHDKVLITDLASQVTTLTQSLNAAQADAQFKPLLVALSKAIVPLLPDIEKILSEAV